MIKAVRQKKRRKRRLYIVGSLVILLAATGGTLHRLSLSLQDISRIIQLAAGKISKSNTKVNESSRLATDIQNALVKTMRKKYGTVADLGVKQAPFFVLIGARMPSVLVEVSFISNPVEERRLKSDRYLDRVADGIVQGVMAYAEGTRTAFLKK